MLGPVRADTTPMAADTNGQTSARERLPSEHSGLEQQTLEQQTRLEAEALFRTVLERAPAIVYTAEVGADARWRYVSPRIEEMLGFTPEEWQADPTLWARQLHSEDRERVLSQVRLGDAETGHENAIDYRLIRRDGEVIWVTDDAVIEHDAEGTPVWHGVLYDITERKHAEQALERLAAQQASLAELGEQAVAGTDLRQLMSAAAKLVCGDGVTHACVWERAPHGGGLRLRAGLDRGAPGLSGRVTASPETHVAAAARLSEAIVIGDWLTDERYEMPPALRMLGVRSSLAVVIESDDGPFGVLDIHSDIPDHFGPADIHLAQSAANVLASSIQRRTSEAELRHRVLHDGLTGLPNRQLFMEMLERALARSARQGTPVAVLFLDLDHFKLINDSLGHHVGDELLRIVAPRLAGRLRPADIVARFGGDEFGMLVEDLADEAEAVAIADRISRSLARPVSIEGLEHYVTASIGIAVVDPMAEKEVDAESVIRDADAAMYKAKERGRARHQLFGEEMRAQAVRRLETQRRLRHAVDRGELLLDYQPVISLSGGAVIGTEALVRWRHPERGLLAPNEFIPVAEESGLIGEIGRWVMEQAVHQTLQWHEQRPDERPIDIAVNISPRQVTQPGLAEMVEALLERTGFEPGHLVLEITESVLVEESVGVRETLQRLHELGVQLVLDDFGTGYSSLAYLSRFPLSALKIDRSFIEKLGGGDGVGEGEAIVQAILAMAEALSLEVIAEGVSETCQAAALRRLGCEYAQGFLFAYPLPPDRIPGFLAEAPSRARAAITDS